MERLVWVSLGANLGSPTATLAAARAALAERFGPLLSSPVVGSSPWGGVAQPDFANQVLGFSPPGAPDPTLRELLRLEAALGRRRDQERRWGPRTIDIDILCWPGVSCASTDLTLPHPRLAERRFVLAPWAEVAPHLVPFGLHRSVAELLVACPDSGAVWPWPAS